MDDFTALQNARNRQAPLAATLKPAQNSAPNPSKTSANHPITPTFVLLKPTDKCKNQITKNICDALLKKEPDGKNCIQMENHGCIFSTRILQRQSLRVNFYRLS